MNIPALLLQISPDQWRTVMEAGRTLIIPVAMWGGRKAIAKLDEKIQLAATARVEDLRETLTNHIDRKFQEHDECDRKILDRLSRIEAAMVKGTRSTHADLR